MNRATNCFAVAADHLFEAAAKLLEKRLIAQQQASVDQRRADDGVVASELHGVARFANARTELQTDVEDALGKRPQQFGDLLAPHDLIEKHQIDVGVGRALPTAVTAQADDREIGPQFVGVRVPACSSVASNSRMMSVSISEASLAETLRAGRAAIVDRADFRATSVQFLLERLQRLADPGTVRHESSSRRCGHSVR